MQHIWTKITRWINHCLLARLLRLLNPHPLYQPVTIRRQNHDYLRQNRSATNRYSG